MTQTTELDKAVRAKADMVRALSADGFGERTAVQMVEAIWSNLSADTLRQFMPTAEIRRQREKAVVAAFEANIRGMRREDNIRHVMRRFKLSRATVYRILKRRYGREHDARTVGPDVALSRQDSHE